MDNNNNNKVLVVCTTDSMITNFLIPHIQDLKNRGCQVDCACAQTGDFINIIRNNGIQVHKVDFHRNPFSFGNVKAFRQLCRLIKTERYNVIFCHEPVGGAMGRIVGHMYNCKVIYMAHGFHFFKGAPKKNRLFYYVEKFLSRWTDVLVTINQEDYDASKQFSCKNLVILNGIGVDTTRFCYEPNRDYIKKIVGDENVVLLSVGELIPRKNHEVVIKAIASLNDKSIHYLVAGEGELMSYLTNLATRLAICDQIHLLGYRTDINKLCNACDIYIMPSLQEGLSVALMEAMAAGNAIIASSIRGNTDLIDANGGILVSPCDIKEYAVAIRKLADSKELRKQMGIYNIKRVKDYDISFVRKQMTEVFDIVLGL